MHLRLIYIDPGAGSYVVQVIIAAVLGVIFYFKTTWSRIKFFFKNKKDHTSEKKG